MNAEKIYNTLHDAGFDVTPCYPYLVVSLKRPISKLEVWAALGFEGNTDGWIRSNGKVFVKC